MRNLLDAHPDQEIGQPLEVLIHRSHLVEEVGSQGSNTADVHSSFSGSVPQLIRGLELEDHARSDRIAAGSRTRSAGGSTTPTPGCRTTSSPRPSRPGAGAAGLDPEPPTGGGTRPRPRRDLARAAAALFAGQDLPGGSQPIAQAYAGHQYGGFTMLGDGRAILLGEHRTPAGQLVDIQLKGPGRTRFSRGGDGRAALGPMLREYIISEAMHALGIPTTRSLAVVTTGEPVFRTTALRGAILTRVAASHIRVGTFEYCGPAGRGDATGAGRLHDRSPLPGAGRLSATSTWSSSARSLTARPRSSPGGSSSASSTA